MTTLELLERLKKRGYLEDLTFEETVEFLKDMADEFGKDISEEEIRAALKHVQQPN